MGVLRRYDYFKEKQIGTVRGACEIVIADIREQNNDCKKRLSDFLSAIFSPNLLEEAEIFQSRLLMMDHTIDIIREEMIQLEKFLLSQPSDSSITEYELAKISQELSFKAKLAKQRFNELKADFFTYITGIA